MLQSTHLPTPTTINGNPTTLCCSNLTHPHRTLNPTTLFHNLLETLPVLQTKNHHNHNLYKHHHIKHHLNTNHSNGENRRKTKTYLNKCSKIRILLDTSQVYNSNLLSTPRGGNQPGSVASSWNQQYQQKIPLGESYGSANNSFTYDQSSFLGFSPFQPFSQSPPEPSPSQGRGGGRLTRSGGKQYGQSPAFSNSPPDRKGKEYGQLGSTPSARSFQQQSPPKPIINKQGKRDIPSFSAPSTPTQTPSTPINSTTPGSSPKSTRSPNSFMKSPSNNPNYYTPVPPNNNYSTNNNYKSPRHQPSGSASAPTTPKQNQQYTPRRGNHHNYNSNYRNYGQQYQPKQMEGVREDGDGFMLFAPDEEILGQTPTESIPDPDNPTTHRQRHPMTNSGGSSSYMDYSRTHNDTSTSNTQEPPKNSSNLLPNILDNT